MAVLSRPMSWSHSTLDRVQHKIFLSYNTQQQKWYKHKVIIILYEQWLINTQNSVTSHLITAHRKDLSLKNIHLR